MALVFVKPHAATPKALLSAYYSMFIHIYSYLFMFLIVTLTIRNMILRGLGPGAELLGGEGPLGGALWHGGGSADL